VEDFLKSVPARGHPSPSTQLAMLPRCHAANSIIIISRGVAGLQQHVNPPRAVQPLPGAPAQSDPPSPGGKRLTVLSTSSSRRASSSSSAA